jgi:hypothetical protein
MDLQLFLVLRISVDSVSCCVAPVRCFRTFILCVLCGQCLHCLAATFCFCHGSDSGHHRVLKLGAVGKLDLPLGRSCLVRALIACFRGGVFSFFFVYYERFPTLF